MWISVQRVALGSLINLVMCILTAYPLSKSKEQFMGRDIYMLYFFITCLVGGGLVPTYLVVARLGLKDSLWALIFAGGPSGCQYDYSDEFYTRFAQGAGRGGND